MNLHHKHLQTLQQSYSNREQVKKYLNNISDYFYLTHVLMCVCCCSACNVWFLGSVDLESLTGVQGVQKATTVIFSMDPPSTSTIVHFKVSAQGITLTDNQRK